MSTRLPALEGWVPMHLGWESTGPVVEWCHLGHKRLTAPFYDQTISEAMRSQFNLVFHHRTPVGTLLDWAAEHPGIPPTGFIFHMSRCGSTLVSRMLAALHHTVVVSEPPPLNAVLRAGNRGVDEAQRLAWLRAMISALGQPRVGTETQFFVKFDNAHTLDLPLIRRAFPEVPWIFMYRDPVEVMVSQLDNPAPHMLGSMGDAGVPGLDPRAAMHMRQEEYCARMLAAICSTALAELESSGGLAVAYTDLPEVVWTQVGRHFGTEWSEAEVQVMKLLAPYHAKNPSFFFSGDQESKQKQASADVRELCATWLEPLYARLRQLGQSA